MASWQHTRVVQALQLAGGFEHGLSSVTGCDHQSTVRRTCSTASGPCAASAATM